MTDQPVSQQAASASSARSPGRLWYMAGLLCTTNAVAFIDRSSLPLLVDQIKGDLHVSDTEMSYLIGLAFILSYSILGFLAGVLVDRFPRRALIASGIVLWSASTAFCGVAHSFWTMFAGRLGIGSGESVSGPGSMSLIRDAFPAHKRGRAVAIWAMGANIGGAAALLGGGAILKLIGDATSVTLPLLGAVRPWQAVLLACAAAPLPLVVLLFTFPEPKRMTTLRSGGRGLGDAFGYTLQRWKIFIPLFLVNGITMILLIGYATWIPAMFGRVWHLSRPEIGFTLGILTLVLATSCQFGAGAIMDRLEQAGVRHPIPIFGIIAAVLTLGPAVVMPLAPSATTAWVLLGLYMLTGTCRFTIGTNFVTALSPPEMAGKITSIQFFWVGVCGTALGPTIFAVVSDKFFQGPAAIAYSLSSVAGVLDIVAILLYALLLAVSRSEENGAPSR